MCLQSLVLPVFYRYYSRKKIDENLVLFADAHHDGLPDAMEEMCRALEKEGKEVRFHCMDYAKASWRAVMTAMLRFMRDYGRAAAVFICDYYLPVSSCRRRPETRVIQLWHACGALKKFGFDAGEDIPGFYRGNPMKNVTLVTVSAPWCVPIYARAMGLPEENIKALGVSRTDRYYSEAYNERCRAAFYKSHPEAVGKKIVLWAPTFRGNAAAPRLTGSEAVEDLSDRLGDAWYVIRKLHPHLEGRAGYSSCREKTEELLPVCDVLITDYSSILFDYMIYQKPLVLYAPDETKYNHERGMYIAYREIPGQLVHRKEQLAEAVQHPVYDREKAQRFFEAYMSACDGHATERILQELR